MQPVFRKTG